MGKRSGAKMKAGLGGKGLTFRTFSKPKSQMRLKDQEPYTTHELAEILMRRFKERPHGQK